MNETAQWLTKECGLLFQIVVGGYGLWNFVKIGFGHGDWKKATFLLLFLAVAAYLAGNLLELSNLGGNVWQFANALIAKLRGSVK